MQINLILFGQLVDITGSSTLTLKNVTDTNELIQQLHTLYPALTNTRYAIALNMQMIHENIVLDDHSTVALLPPFSGG